MSHDLTYAFRSLRKNPGFALAAIGTLALGIGATTAIFSVVNAVLLRPLPYKEPARLVHVWHDLRARNVVDFPFAPGDFHDLREQMTSTFEAVGAVQTFRNVISGPGLPAPEVLRGAAATPNIFKLLGASIVAGQDFDESDGTPLVQPPPAQAAAAGAPAPPAAPPPPPAAAILSHAFWQRRFGGDRAILGTVVDLGGPRFLVKGVLAPDFELLFPPNTSVERLPDVWVAMRQNFAAGSRTNVSLRVIGRLKPGVSITQAQSQVDVLAADLRKRFVIKDTAGFHLRLAPMQEDLVADVRGAILALMGAVVFVLLIACANVANLFLVRSAARARELAVRAALGGSRARLVRQMLVESVTIAAIGAALGLGLAWLGIRLLLLLRPDNLPRLTDVALDPAVLAFASVATLVSAVTFGLVPALRASRPDVVEVLRHTGRTGGLAAGRWLRAGVVVAEVALSCVLLVGSGLMVRSFVALQRADPGYDWHNVLTFQIPNLRRPEAEARAAFIRELRERLSALPGVTAVTAAGPLPLDGGISLARWGTMAALSDPSKFQQATIHSVQPEYFDVMRVRGLEGRTFSAAENVPGGHLIMIDRVLAARAFPNESAVGKKILARMNTDEPEQYEIIGVVPHQRHVSLAADGREAIFVPDGFFGFGAASRWAVRTAGNPAEIVALVRREVAALDPLVGIIDVQPMSFYVDRAQAQIKFALVLIGLFAAVAFVLAAVGLYGVLSTAVRQRTAEIGVRMAFGAGSASIFRMMLSYGLGLSAVGLVIGLLAAGLLTGFLQTMLVGVTPTDPVTFASIALLFLTVAAVATGVPALRAARLDPTVALREE